MGIIPAFLQVISRKVEQCLLQDRSTYRAPSQEWELQQDQRPTQVRSDGSLQIPLVVHWDRQDRGQDQTNLIMVERSRLTNPWLQGPVAPLGERLLVPLGRHQEFTTIR